jgi:uncharacterized protein YabE (DUF348 family)
VDGKTYTAITAERDPQILLAQWGLKLNQGDRLLLAGRTMQEGDELPQASYLSLDLRHAVNVQVQDGDNATEFQSSAPTLGEALAEQGIELLSSDHLDPAPETALDEPIVAALIRSEPVIIVIGVQTLEVRTSASTVGQVLAEIGISLQGLDRSEPDEDQPLPSDRRIRIVRINESVQVEQDTITHEIEWQEDPEAELDTISVIQAGQDGVTASRIRTRYEDGEEVSQIQEGERTLAAAKDQVNGYGSKLVLHTITINGVAIEYYRAVSVYTTWYSPCNSGVSTCLNGTSSGMPVQRGTIATYLSWYRALKGTTVYIPDYGYAAIGDVGSYPTGEPWIDLAFSEAEVAASNGNPWVNKNVTIYFTTPVPSYIPPTWPPG